MPARSRLRQLVFISYSREPDGNSMFVRELARALRSSGFDPWLDEERIAGATDFEAEIRAAIKEARHGLFVLTRRWLTRPFTRMELNLFAEKDPSTHYRVAINREGLAPSDVAAQLQQLHIIDWREDDPLPDARTWEVYAALTRRPPGPRDEWAEKGRRLIVVGDDPGPDPVPVPVPAPGHARAAEDPGHGPGGDWAPCRSRPSLALSTGESTILLTDGGECFRVGPGPAARPLPPLRSWAAAAASDGSVVVTLYNRMFVRLRGDDWEYRSLEAIPLSVAGGHPGASVGDSAGGVTCFPADGTRPRSIPFGRPVAELLSTDDGVIALGEGGQLGRACWDDPARGFEPLEVPGDFGRPAGLFRPHDPAGVGVFSAGAVAVMDGGLGPPRVGKARFPDGIRAVVPIGRQPGHFAVLTDAGRLLSLELARDSAPPIRLPIEPDEAVGIARCGTAGALAWTAGGALFFVAQDRTVRNLGVGDVALACPDPSGIGPVQVVRWVEGRGLQVRPVRVDQAR